MHGHTYLVLVWSKACPVNMLAMLILDKWVFINTVEPRSIVFQGDGENDECGKTMIPGNHFF
jgi:hypothetical protein